MESVTPEAMPAQAFEIAVRITLRSSLAELSRMTPKQLIDDRYDKFRKMGSFFTETAAVGR